MRNSFRSYGINDSQLDEIWSVIDAFDKKNAITNGSMIPNPQNNNNFKSDVLDESYNEKYGKKLQFSDEGNIVEEKINSNNEFDWFYLIKNECEKSNEKLIRKQKLQKKVKIIALNLNVKINLTVKIFFSYSKSSKKQTQQDMQKELIKTSTCLKNLIKSSIKD
jgi:hypothetical protein